MGKHGGFAYLLGLFTGLCIYTFICVILPLWIGANGYFASWFWRRSLEFEIQHRTEDREYGILGFTLCVIKASSPVLLLLILILIICLGMCTYCVCLVRQAKSKKKEIRLSKGKAIFVAVVLGTLFIIILSGFVTANSLLLARLSKWLPHFKAQGESPNSRTCTALIVALSFELALMGVILLPSIVLLAIGICILVFYVCSRKKQWTWNEFHDSFKHYSKIDIENCFEKFMEWCGRRWWGKKFLPRQENSPVLDQIDSQEA